MNAFKILPLMLLSMPSYAVTDGTPVDWQAHDYTVRLDTTSNTYGQARQGQCAGTVIAGKYILTAAHCLAERGDVDTVTSVNGDRTPVPYSQFRLHPEYLPEGSDNWLPDAGIIPLDSVMTYQHIQFFADPNVALTKGQAVKVTGFGGTASDSRPLQYADFTLQKTRWHGEDDGYWDSDKYWLIWLDLVNESRTTDGDSGSAWSNEQNEIIAIHKGSKYPGEDHQTYGTNIPYIADWLLEQIDGWHYPTVAKVSGQTTLTVQSLHMTNIDDNGFYADGDVSIISNTCGSVEPYQKCELTIESMGGEGRVILGQGKDGSDEVIAINPQESIPMIPIDPPVSQPSGHDKSGGSLGLFSLFGLGGALLRRKKR